MCRHSYVADSFIDDDDSEESDFGEEDESDTSYHSGESS